MDNKAVYVEEAKQIIHDFRYGYDDTTLDELIHALLTVKCVLPSKSEAYTMEEIFMWASD